MRTSRLTFQCATEWEVIKAMTTLKSEGFKMTSDCYWYINFVNDKGEEAYIERV